jgi:hypothetical protein
VLSGGYLLQIHGHLDQSVINADKDGPPLCGYVRQFGKLSRAYARIGFVSPHDKTERDESNARKQEMFQKLMAALREKGWRCLWNVHRKHLVIDDALTLGILIGKYKPTQLHQKHRWFVHTRTETQTDFSVVARLDFSNKNILDYFLLPKTLPLSKTMNLTEALHPHLRTYRFVTHERLLAGLLIQLALYKNSQKGAEFIVNPNQS